MMSSVHISRSIDSGGLSHLVEAASVLTGLVDLPISAKAKTQEVVVSDDDCVEYHHANGNDRVVSKTASTASSTKEIFPQRLMSILSDSSVSDVISWLPHGLSFVVIRPDLLADRVLSKYFSSDPRSSTKYPSFTRKLNRWGFRHATRGPDTGAFHHPLFQRDKPDLCLEMICQKSRKPKAMKSTEAKKDDVSYSSSLPPKKRKIQEGTKEGTATAEQYYMHARVVSDASLSSNSTTTTDDQSVASSSSGPLQAPVPPTVLLLTRLASLPLTTVATTVTNVSGTPSVPSIAVQDPNVIAAALKVREEKERLATAKAMLFDAYIKALNGQ